MTSLRARLRDDRGSPSVELLGALPLILLFAISVTGLLLTASYTWMQGYGYDFLALLPRRQRVAFEFRHASWHADELFDRLRPASHDASVLRPFGVIEYTDRVRLGPAGSSRTRARLRATRFFGSS